MLEKLLARRLELKKKVREANREELAAYNVYFDLKNNHTRLRNQLANVDAKLKKLASKIEIEAEIIRWEPDKLA